MLKQILNKLFERQADIQDQVKKYAPIRDVFEEFLKAGQKLDEGLFWWISPGSRRSRFNWERQEVLDTADGQGVVIEASTDPRQYGFSKEADDIPNALIKVRVSLLENPFVGQALELSPIWAILEQRPDFPLPDLDKLVKDLEEIVPLVRACLP